MPILAYLSNLGMGGGVAVVPPTPAVMTARGGDDVPRRKSPDRGFDLERWKSNQLDLEGSIRETYANLMQGPQVEQTRDIVAPYVQTTEVNWASLVGDREALEQLLVLRQQQEEEEVVMLLLLS
jgi:hypothetical protein